MSAHTLATIITACILMQVGIAVATPNEKRPLTTARKWSLAIAFVQLACLVWLLVTVLA